MSKDGQIKQEEEEQEDQQEDTVADQQEDLLEDLEEDLVEATYQHQVLKITSTSASYISQ